MLYANEISVLRTVDGQKSLLEKSVLKKNKKTLKKVVDNYGNI